MRNFRRRQFKQRTGVGSFFPSQCPRACFQSAVPGKGIAPPWASMSTLGWLSSAYDNMLAGPRLPTSLASLLVLFDCRIPAREIHPSEPQFPHLQNGDRNSSPVTGPL